MSLVQKLAPPQVSPGTWPAFNRYLYVIFKQNSGERFRASWPGPLDCIIVKQQWFDKNLNKHASLNLGLEDIVFLTILIFHALTSADFFLN